MTMDLTRGPTGDELRALRERHKLLQTQAARLVDVSTRQWQNWEAGKPSMPRSTWWLLLLRLGCIELRELPKHSEPGEPATIEGR